MNGRHLDIAIFQPEARDLEPRERLASLEPVLRTHGERLDLLICPELFLCGYGTGEKIAARAEPLDGPFARGAAELARRYGVALLYGYPEQAGARRYNSALCIGADGTRLANHRKLALPSAYETALFEPHAGVTVFELRGWRVGVLVCYDIEFPEAARATAQAGAELLVAPTALGREWDVVARKLIPARAFENGCCLAYANHAGEEGDFHYLGESRIVGPDGRELAVAGGAETVIRARLEKTRVTACRERLPYLRDCRRLVFAGED